jgi:hypothetical protein
MKTKLFFAFLLMNLWATAQETPKEKMERLTSEIKTLVKQEKDSLKLQLEAVDLKVESGAIDKIEAAELKKSISIQSAEKMTVIVTERSNQISELTQEIVREALEGNENDTLPETKNERKIAISISKDIKEDQWQRTQNRMVFAFGLNNVLQDHQLKSLDDSPYAVWNSNFVELGWGYKTSFSNTSSLANVFYGVSFQWNELKLYDNLYHVDIDDQTLVVTHPEDLKKSKLRTSSIIVPLGLEFDFSGTKDVNGEKIPQRNKSVRIGIGGYGGLRINTKQIIKYDAPRDQKKEKIVSNYNMNNLIYGLTGYLGYKDASLYVKYDLNPLFKDTETSNISLGVRFDL